MKGFKAPGNSTSSRRSTPDAFEEVQRQPIWGVELLDDVEFPCALKPIIRWHHERYDGTGYPDRLRGEDIPLSAQIVGIADAYDALTTERPYRKAYSPEAALEKIRGSRGLWSPAVYDGFLASLAPARASAAAVPALP